MASALIVYATREGQTEKIAQRIATVLRARGHVAELLDVDHAGRRPDLGRFGAIVVGSPVRAQGYLRSIVRFARENRELLGRVPSAFFSVGLAVLSKKSDGRAQTLAIVDKFVERTGWRPQHVELIAGALPYSKYNFLIRYVMRRISASEGGDTDTSRDYEYTDWKAVEAFASDFIARAAGTPAIARPAALATSS
ncbi:MAG TPA: flavodoxin domain-containing protein [Myxococcaceae bacterium]|nr:flavodoxin domain-containing protein [Myxococcaceae bacterium]